MSRVYGLGSVFGKTMRDSRNVVVAVALLLAVVVVATMVAIASEFDTVAERAALARQMELLPELFQGLLGKPIEIETLPGFVSWRLIGFMPVMVGLWSVVALAATLAGEASRGSLEMVLALPVSRRSLAAQKWLGHAVALTIVIAFTSLVAWAGSIAFATLPGDEMNLAEALAEFALVGAISLFAGSIAFVAANLLGRGVGAGIASFLLIGSFIVNGYSGLVPGFDVLRLGSVFYWTRGHRPMAGVYDWLPVAVVVLLALGVAILGAALFMRRDLGARVGLPGRLRGRRLGGGLPALGRWSLRGPGSRSFADRLPEAAGWGIGLGLYGLLISFAVDSFEQVFNSIPQISQMVRLVYPDFNFDSVGNVLQFAIFAFVSLLVGIAASSLIHGWSADERLGRLEMVLSTPVQRVAWALRSGGGLLIAIMLMGALIGLGPAIGAAIKGEVAPTLIGGGLVLSLYAAALAGFGLLVAGLGRPGWAAIGVVALTLTFYLLDLLGPLLDFPEAVLDLSLTQHLGRPMAGSYDIVGIAVLAALALGGLVIGAWAFARRDLRAS